MAWNFDFPTRIELLVWRYGSLWTATYDPVLVMLGLVLGGFELFEARRMFVIPFLTFLYILARLALIVEGSRTLLFLPDDAFVSTWASEIR